MDARVAGILALEANRLLQPRAWAALEDQPGQGTRQWRPVWVLPGDGAGDGGEHEGTSDRASARGRSSAARGGDRSLSAPRFAASWQPPPPGPPSRSRSRSESTARGASGAASLPLSGRVRAQCLALVACLAARHPKALASHWALLLPDGPAPPSAPQPPLAARWLTAATAAAATILHTPASAAPGPPPLLLLLEWAEEGRVRAQAAAALAAMLSTGKDSGMA